VNILSECSNEMYA